jgi:hypothetical protein
MGYLKKELSREDKQELLGLIEDCRLLLSTRRLTMPLAGSCDQPEADLIRRNAAAE